MLGWAALGLSLVLGPSVVRAQSPARPVQAQSAEVVAVGLEQIGGSLPEKDLRDAIARELGAQVVPLGSNAPRTLRITIRHAQRTFTVVSARDSGSEITRTLALPADRANAITAVALLAGNLARDQASEVLADLKKAHREAGPGAAPAGTAEASPEAPPAATAPAPPPPATAPPSAPSAPAIPESPARPERAGGGPCTALVDRSVTVSFFHPINTHRGLPCVRAKLDLDLPYGEVEEVDGAQIGFVSSVSGNLSGAQFALFYGRVAGNVRGIAGSILVSNVGGDLRGVQVSTITNVAGGVVGGAQMALVNVGGDVRGAQIGLVNIGGKLGGAQIGLVNVASELDGGDAFGIVNVGSWDHVHPMLWASREYLSNVGLKLASTHFYSLLSASLQPGATDQRLAAGIALGFHLPVSEFFADADVGLVWPFSRQPSGDGLTTTSSSVEVEGRVLAGWRIASHFSLFAGTGLRGGRTPPSTFWARGEYLAGIQF